MGCGASKSSIAVPAPQKRSDEAGQINSIRTVRSMRRKSDEPVKRRSSIKPLEETRCRELLVGCDYRETENQLYDGTIARNDIRTINNAIATLDFSISDRKLMFDEVTDVALVPTRANILREIDWLVQGACTGDALLFMFSGRSDSESGALLPIDHAEAGAITHEELFERLVKPLGKGVRLTVLLACPFAPSTAPLMLEHKWVADPRHVFLEPNNGDDPNWRPTRLQQEINRLGFRRVEGRKCAAQVIVLYADDRIDAAHGQFVSQFSHPWKQRSTWGPAGSHFANTLAQVIFNNAVPEDNGFGATAAASVKLSDTMLNVDGDNKAVWSPGRRGMRKYISFGIGALLARMRLQLDRRGYDGAALMAFSHEVDLYAPFSMLPMRDEDFCTPGYVEIRDDADSSGSPTGTAAAAGRCKSLFIGVDYFGTTRERDSNGRNDVLTMISSFAALGVDVTQRSILVEDSQLPGVFGAPTRASIMERMTWLVSGCRSGDTLVFFFSGHAAEGGTGVLACDCDYGADGGVISSQELASVLLQGLRPGVKMTAVFAAPVINPLRLKAKFVLQDGMNFVPPAGAEPDWRPPGDVHAKNLLCFQDTRREVTHEGQCVVFAACSETVATVFVEKFTHCWKNGPTGTAFVQSFAQTVFNNTRNGKASAIGLGQFFQRMGKNLRMRRLMGEGQLYHSVPPPDLYKTWTPRAGDTPCVPLTVTEAHVTNPLSDDMATSQLGASMSASASRNSSRRASSVAMGSSLRDLNRPSQRNFGRSGAASGGGQRVVATHPMASHTGGVNEWSSGEEQESAGESDDENDAAVMEKYGIRVVSSSHGNGGANGKSARRNGRCKSLFVGLDYSNSPALAPNPGGPYDVLTAMEFLMHMGFDVSNRQVLVDNIAIPQRTGHPTKAAMQQGMQWLLKGAAAGDTFVVVFSGSARQIHDDDNDEEDGLDEHFVLDKGETISDDEVFSDFLLKVPDGCRVTWIVDAPHSATICDLPFGYKWSPDHSFAAKKTRSQHFLSTLPTSRGVTASGGSKATSVDRATVGKNVLGWRRVGNKDLRANCLCVTSSADDDEEVQIDITTIKHPWKYSKKGGVLIHALAEQVYHSTVNSDGSLSLCYGELISNMQKHLIVRGSMLNQINLSAQLPVDMTRNFSLFGVLPTSGEAGL